MFYNVQILLLDAHMKMIWCFSWLLRRCIKNNAWHHINAQVNSFAYTMCVCMFWLLHYGRYFH